MFYLKIITTKKLILLYKKKGKKLFVFIPYIPFYNKS